MLPFLLQLRNCNVDTHLLLYHYNLLSRVQTDASRVIATVFKALQPTNKQRKHLAPAAAAK